MTTQQKSQCMFVGIDVHKDTHTAVGISPFGEKMFEITVGNYKNDFENLTNKVEEMKGVCHQPYLSSSALISQAKNLLQSVSEKKLGRTLAEFRFVFERSRYFGKRRKLFCMERVLEKMIARFWLPQNRSAFLIPTMFHLVVLL